MLLCERWHYEVWKMAIDQFKFIIMSHIKRYLPSLLQQYFRDKSQTVLDANTLKDISFNRIDAVHSYMILGSNSNP